MSDEIAEARAKETTFVSNVSGRPESSRRRPLSKKARTKGFLKKHAPLLVILSVLITGVCLIFVSQSFMPFAIVNRFIEEYNGAGISSILRTDSLLDTQLSSTGSYFGLSENQRTAFKDSGIYPVDFAASGANNTALVYRESDGTYRAVVPKSVAQSGIDVNSLIAQNLSDSTITSVSSYFALYMLSFAAIFLLLSLEPFDFETIFTAVAACFNNVGPGLGAVGPASSYAVFSPFAKILLSVAMLLGRLEIYPLLLTMFPLAWSK